jgi:predicted restriction endonuclease
VELNLEPQRVLWIISMASKKQLVREAFRDAVFARDNHRCKIPGCGKAAVDAHHITDRNEMPNGGYVKHNGISLCEADHLKAEIYHTTEGKEWPDGFHPNDLYKLIGSSYESARVASLKLK